jgi:hypothetical protein
MLRLVTTPLLFLTARKGCITCTECPADALCHDDSLAGQMARVMAEPHPAIVRSVRVQDLLLNAKNSAST